MSVRRLADEAVQPTTFAFSAENDNWATRLVGRYPAGRQQSAVIPLLMRAQEQDGWVTRAAIEHIADRLQMPLIRVLEVATFYTQFQLKPVGTKAHIQVCGTTPCMLRGAEALKDVCRKHIHPEQQHLNASGTLSWEEVECLGACVNAPMVMVFKDTYEDLTPERLAEIIGAFERGEEVPVGPQIDRHLSVPVGGLTTLTRLGDDEDVGERDEKAAVGSSPSQGIGAGDAVSVEPSQAGRVDTHAEETDPTVRSPATDRGIAADPALEEAASADPDAGAGPGAGRTGGTRQGATDAGAKEAAAENAAVKEPAARTAGSGRTNLADREGTSEDAVVSDKFQPEDGGGSQKRRVRPAPVKGPSEGERAASDDTGTADPAAAKAPAKRRTAKSKTDEPDGSRSE